MAKVIIKVNVAYAACFLTTLKAQAETQKTRGGRNFTTGAEDGEHNVIYAILEWASVSSAKRFWNSLEAKVQIAEWHSVQVPEIKILRETGEG